MMDFSFVAESTGHQISSRLLSMKSANALLELPATGNVISAGNYVSAIIISDISNAVMGEDSFSSDSASGMQGSVSQDITAKSQDAVCRVAVLTVSDTVASGAGPDRRYTTSCYFFVCIIDWSLTCALNRCIFFRVILKQKTNFLNFCQIHGKYL